MQKRRISITTRLLSYLLLAGIVPLVLLGVSAFDRSETAKSSAASAGGGAK